MKIIKENSAFFLFLVIVVLFNMIGCETKRANKYKETSNKLEQAVSLANQKVKISEIKLQDSLKVKQAEIEKLQVTSKNLQSLYGELLKSSKVKPKNVKELISISTVVSGVDTVVCLVDTFGGLKANWKDDYINVKVNIDTNRVAALDYSIKDSLTVISYQKKHSLLFGLIKWSSFEGCKVITHNPKSIPVTVISYSNISK